VLNVTLAVEVVPVIVAALATVTAEVVVTLVMAVVVVVADRDVFVELRTRGPRVRCCQSTGLPPDPGREDCGSESPRV